MESENALDKCFPHFARLSQLVCSLTTQMIEVHLGTMIMGATFAGSGNWKVASFSMWSACVQHSSHFWSLYFFHLIIPKFPANHSWQFLAISKHQFERKGMFSPRVLHCGRTPSWMLAKICSDFRPGRARLRSRLTVKVRPNLQGGGNIRRGGY